MGITQDHLEREMTFKTTKLRDAITFALAAGATTLVGTGVAFAQETEGQEATTLDRIEVTGSRIRRTDVETSQPIFQLSREDIQAQGLTSIGDVIQNITANGSTLNSTLNNGGNGESRVDLRYLGSGRTLVLVNGRRWVGGTGLGGAVDLNTIPTAAVERIEVLKDGASVIYGSDAIAGVVNIILRDDFDGAEANAYIGQFDKGDGTRQAYDFTVGTVSDRFSAMMGLGYVKEEPVHAGDREISKEPTIRTGTSFGSSTTPDGRFALCPDGWDTATNSCSGAQTDHAGNPGTFTVPGGVPRAFVIPDDIYNFAPDNYLLTPQERVSLFASGKLDITDNLRFKVTAHYNERRSEQLLAAMPIVLGTGPGAGVQSQTVFISADSLYNPFGQDVSRIQYRATETGGRSFRQNVDTFVTNLGLEGDFEIGERFFDWEAGYFYGENEQNDTTEGLFNVPALRDGLGPSMIDPVSGVPICVRTPGDASTAIVGCVPLNLLSGRGSMTPEQLAYASFVAHDELGYKQKTYYANVSGDLFDLPGGPFAFAAGVEHREEDGFNQPDALIASGNTTGNALAPTSGGYDVDEVYLELAIPVLADVPGAQLLDFSLATRYSDYSTFGDTLNSKFGFRWKPIEDLMVRGNWTEGFRAPSVGELFGGVGDSFPTIADPCSTTFGGLYNALSPAQQAACHAQGVPVGGYDQGNAQIRISVGGNVDLQPETSTTKTLGLVYSPGFVEGLDISLDWWNIELQNTISVFGGQQILDFCIVDGIQNFCNAYTRTPDGAIDVLLASGLNVGSTEVEGFDMTLSYRLPEFSWGRVSFTWDTTYMTTYEQDLDGDGIRAEEVDDGGGNQVGEYQGGTTGTNRWRIRSNLATRWELGDFGATWNARFYSRQEEDCPFYYNDYGFGELCNDPVYADEATSLLAFDDAGNALSQNKIGSTTYHDISGYWNSPWNARVTLGINNVFDKDPPVAFTAFANSFDAQYEVPGRFYYLRYTQKF
jgi:iron complex outermembrane recepter protein